MPEKGGDAKGKERIQKDGRIKEEDMMKKIHNLKLFGLVAFLAFALFFIGVDFIEGQKKKPPGQDKKGDDAFQDMPLCITEFNTGQLYTNVDFLCASSSGITAFAGRRWSIFLGIHKRISNPYLFLSLDPLPGKSGDPPNAVTPPSLPNGPIFEPEFMVGLLEQIKDMTKDLLETERTQLFFKDATGQTYHLYWGPGPWPGERFLTNTSAPPVIVDRIHGCIVTEDGDAIFDSPREWDVYTKAEFRYDDQGDPIIAHTAFLWLRLGPGAWQYCGAYNVSFSYHATEE